MTDTIRDLQALMAPLDPARRNPQSDEELLREAPSVHSLMQRPADTVPLTGAKPPRPGWSRKRVLKWTMPGLVVAVAGGTVAASALRGDKPADLSNVVRCYTVDHLSTNAHQYTDTSQASSTGQPAPDASAVVANAVDACAGLWTIGLLIPGNANNTAALPNQDTNNFPVPNLVACVLDSGEAAIFPSTDDQLCQHLGVARLVDRK